MKSLSVVFPWLKVIIVVWAAVSCEDLAKTTCAELQVFPSGSTAKVITVRDGGYVNITFELTTNKCQYEPDWFRIRVATSQNGFRLPICTIIFRGYTCNVTKSSNTCHCLGHMYASMYMRVSPSETTFILEWTDATTIPKQQEKTILLEAEEGGSRTLVIVGVCFVLLVMVVAAAIIAFLRKSRGMRHQSRCTNSSTTYINTHETLQTGGIATSEDDASNQFCLHIGVPQGNKTTSSSRVATDYRVLFLTPSTPNTQVPEESHEISHTAINAQSPVVVYTYDHISF